ncbi:hypothetical protein TREES_T100002606 [Tupaia chinensis]|uniref:Uncharacterized protein n=1 Tax=Tupaia chinensis TaxID=246437 RepID=L9L5M8_TUPCH|nr:hypothetical protein TREES_T100002606 [Tupaia chinensis]
MRDAVWPNLEKLVRTGALEGKEELEKIKLPLALLSLDSHVIGEKPSHHYQKGEHSDLFSVTLSTTEGEPKSLAGSWPSLP